MAKETVVHVTTIEEWKAVLDVWFEQGHTWASGDKRYRENYFNAGSRQLGHNVSHFAEISYWSMNDYTGDNLIEYSEFIAKQKEDNKMITYYVTKEQLDLIDKLKSDGLPFYNLVNSTTTEMKTLSQHIPDELDRPILRYLGGDETIEFEVKETLYRLWRIDENKNKLYFYLYHGTEPDWSANDKEAFTAPLEEIKKWQTPAWEIEEV